MGLDFEREIRRVLTEGIGDIPIEVDSDHPVAAVASDVNENTAAVVFACHAGSGLPLLHQEIDVWRQFFILERRDGEPWDIVGQAAISASGVNPLSQRASHAELGSFVAPQGGGEFRSRLMNRRTSAAAPMVRYACFELAAQVRRIEVWQKNAGRQIDATRSRLVVVVWRGRRGPIMVAKDETGDVLQKCRA